MSFYNSSYSLVNLFSDGAKSDSILTAETETELDTSSEQIRSRDHHQALS